MFQNDVVKKYEEIDHILYCQSLIEICEKVLLGKEYEAWTTSSKKTIWEHILYSKIPGVDQLRSCICQKNSKYLNVRSFPDYISLAYRYYCDRIHQYVNERSKVDLQNFELMPSHFVGREAAQDAISVLLNVCTSTFLSSSDKSVLKKSTVGNGKNKQKIAQKSEIKKSTVGNGKNTQKSVEKLEIKKLTTGRSSPKKLTVSNTRTSADKPMSKNRNTQKRRASGESPVPSPELKKRKTSNLKNPVK